MAKPLKSPGKTGTPGRVGAKGGRVDGLRSVDLGVTDLKSRARFYTDIWRLAPVVEHPGSVYLRGTGA